MTTAPNSTTTLERTFFGYIQGVPQEFASGDVAHVETAVVHGIDIHVFIRPERLPSRVVIG